MNSYSCVYTNCSNARKKHKLSFFKFPTTEERQQIWIKNSGNFGLFDLNSKQLQARVICELHFPSKYIIGTNVKKGLVRHAIPLHYTEGDNSTKNLPRLRTPPSPSYLSVLPVRKVYTNGYSDNGLMTCTDHSIGSSLDYPKNEIDLVTSTSTVPSKLKAIPKPLLSNSDKKQILECESDNLPQPVMNNALMPESTIKQEILQFEEIAEVPRQGDSNLSSPIINREIILSESCAPEDNHLEPICAEVPKHGDSNLPLPIIKREINLSGTWASEDNHLEPICAEVPKQGDSNLPLPIINREINLSGSWTTEDNRLEPICFVSTTETINEDIFENLPGPMEEEDKLSQEDDKLSQKEDQCDAFGKFVASELRDVKSESLRKELKLKILNILTDIRE